MRGFRRSGTILATAIVVFLSMVIGAAHAATTRTWPGVAPCGTTLQACIDASASGDTVQVQSNATIDESLSVNKPFSLVAAIGYRPVLAAGRDISASPNPGAVDWSLLIDGFTLLQGSVAVRAVSGNGNVTLRRLDVTAIDGSFTGSNAIGIENFSAGSLTYAVERNRVRVNDSIGLHAIEVTCDKAGPFQGSVHDNRIESLSTATTDAGIFISGTGASAPSVLVYSNQLSGNLDTGIWLWVAGQSNLVFASNVVRTTVSNSFGAELILTSGVSNALNANVFNNTIAGFGQGLVTNGALTGRISGNLFAYDSVIAIHQQGSTMTEDHSLFFGGPAPTLGTGSMVADPKFRHGIDDMRLTAGSPAIDAADTAALVTLLTNAVVPEIDGDGLRRFKGATNLADIGAFEYGDGALIESVTAGNGGVIDNALLNGNSAALPQVLQDSTPDTYASLAIDSGNTALAYASNHFGVIDESDGTGPTAGSAYNVFVPAAGDGAFLHLSDAGNVFGFATEINNSYTDGHGERIVLATHRSTPLFNHPLGVVYGFGHWFIGELDSAVDFPPGINFHVYAQDPSLNAFVWTVPADTTSTVLDHPLLNGEPCGRVYVGNGNINPHAIGVEYAQGRWAIVNLDGGTMPLSAQFNVVVDEAAIVFCRYDHIFHNGFDGS